MTKKLLAVLFSALLLICLTACTTANNADPSATNGTSTDTTATNEINGPTDLTGPVFKTESVAHITINNTYGVGEGHLVPDEYKDEIISWLKSFKIGEAVDTSTTFPPLPPGTDSIVIKLVYSDGTVYENGTDTVKIDGVVYHLTSDPEPDCYYEILRTNSATK